MLDLQCTLKALSELDIHVLILKTDYFNCDRSTQETHIFTAEKHLRMIKIEYF